MLKTTVSVLALSAALGLAPAAFAQDAQTTQTEQPAAGEQQGTQQGGAEVIVVQPEGQQQGTTTEQPAAGTTTTTQTEGTTTTTEPAQAETTTTEGTTTTQTEETTTTTQPVQTETTTQPAEGENIGEVNDIVVNSNGTIEGVVIGVGGFLGIGEKDVAVRLDQITIQQDPDDVDDLTFVLNV